MQLMLLLTDERLQNLNIAKQTLIPCFPCGNVTDTDLNAKLTTFGDPWEGLHFRPYATCVGMTDLQDQGHDRAPVHHPDEGLPGLGPIFSMKKGQVRTIEQCFWGNTKHVSRTSRKSGDATMPVNTDELVSVSIDEGLEGTLQMHMLRWPHFSPCFIKDAPLSSRKRDLCSR